jgi:hypothetical protein
LAKYSAAAYEKKVQQFVKRIPSATKRTLGKGAEIVAEEMRRNLSGRVLKRQSGDLYNAVEKEVSIQPLRARVGISDKQQYKAQTHEHGRRITAKRKPYLVFAVDGRVVKTKSVYVPPRPFAGPALDAKRPEVIDLIRRSLLLEYKASG